MGRREEALSLERERHDGVTGEPKNVGKLESVESLRDSPDASLKHGDKSVQTLRESASTTLLSSAAGLKSKTRMRAVI